MICGMAEAKIVKFCVQVDYQFIVYGDQPPLKAVWSDLRKPFFFQILTAVISL